MPKTPSRPTRPEPMTAVGTEPAAEEVDCELLDEAVAVLPPVVVVFLVVRPLAVVVRLEAAPVAEALPPLAEAEPEAAPEGVAPAAMASK
jgi:hypothetical protein